MARYMTSVREVDAKMGAVLAALSETGLDRTTLVICTTDHGPAFPRMKCTLTDSGTGVMLIMRGPGGFEGGRVVDSMVGHIDIFPTLCELLGIEPPPWLQGVSLMPLIRGDAESVRDEIFTEVNYHAAYEPMRAIRTPRWKYIRRYDDRQAPVLPNCDDSLSKSLWLEHGWAQMAPEPEMLFDLIFDPNEAHWLGRRSSSWRSWSICAPGWTPGCGRPTTRYCGGRCCRWCCGQRSRGLFASGATWPVA